MPRKEVFSPDEVAMVHVVHRVVRRCFLLGDDQGTGKRGSTSATVRPILERLSLTPDTWTAMVRRFGRLFIHVAGRPSTIDDYRSPAGSRRFHVRGEARQLLSSAA